MNILVGLGNPGRKYANTKHNFGYWIIDEFAQKRSLTFKAGKGDYLIAKSHDVVCIKPTSYMNNSGLAIAEYFKYYGYHESFEDFDAGTWQEELLSEEIYIYTYGGNLRDGEYVFHDTTIITSVADYYVETLYEVEFDDNVIVPFAEVTWEAFSSGDTVCINTPEPVWVNHPEVSFNIPDYQSNYRKFCPPVDTVLTNTFKIIKTNIFYSMNSSYSSLENTSKDRKINR